MPLDAPVTIAARSAMCRSSCSIAPLLAGGIPSHRGRRAPYRLTAVGRCLDCRVVRFVPVLAPAVLVALVVAGCGDSKDTTTSTAISAPAQTAAKPTKADFPKASGKSLGELRQGMQEGLILAPSVSVLQPGQNRYGFALFDAARKQVAEAPVALYVSHTDGTAVRGPYVARSESLAVKPQFQSRTTSSDPNAAKSVYVAQVPFSKPGRYRVTAITKLDGRPVSSSSFSADVRSSATKGMPPIVGAAAPKVSTPTIDDVAGDAQRISTRTPPAPDLLQTDLADVYGKKPVALLFATPALCQSRVCGPVVDVMEQARSELGSDKVAFITNEIYKDNRVDQGLRPQPAAYRLPTEPWLFVLDRQGRVAERIEGAFSVAELEAAVRRVEQAS